MKNTSVARKENVACLLDRHKYVLGIDTLGLTSPLAPQPNLQ